MDTTPAFNEATVKEFIKDKNGQPEGGKDRKAFLGRRTPRADG